MIFILGLTIETVNVTLLEFDLLVGDLVLASLTIDERLIHLVLVVQGGHLEGIWSIGVTE